MSTTSYTLKYFGPSDLLTSDVEGERRVKVDAEITGQPIKIDSVTVENFPEVYPNQHSQPLTDAQLRAKPVPVSGTFTTTPSGTQDVNITGSTEIEVTLNGEPVELWRGGSQADALFVQWNGSQQVTVQDGVVSVDNFPSNYATAAKQLPDNHQVTVSNQITQPTTPSDTQPVSATSLPLPTGAATAAKQLPNNHDVTVSNFPAEYPLPAAQVSALTPQTDGLTDAELRAAPVAVENLAQLVPEQYDEIALSYTGDDLTGVVYKAATVIVATLTLGYTSGKLTSVVRS